MARQFAVTWDYRCPFARNAHEALVAGLKEGRDWDVRFMPFSLDQIHVEEGETPVWERGLDEAGVGGVRALLWGIAVRDAFADKFLDFHVAVFRARHDEGKKIAEEAVLRGVAAGVGLDPDAVAEEVASGRPVKALEAEHTEAVDALRRLRRPHGHRGRRGRVRPHDGAGQRRRLRPRPRARAQHPPQRVQADEDPSLIRSRQPSTASDHSS